MHNYLHSKGLKSYQLGITPFADMVSLVETLDAVMSLKQPIIITRGKLNPAH